MSTIRIDPSLQQFLQNLKEATEVLDKDGNLLGVFKPKSQLDAEVVAIAAKLFDPAELDRIEREESGKGIRFSEVKKRLQALENQG
jgi:hypothetical protein